MLEVDRHGHCLHRTGSASPRRSFVTGSGHIGHGLGLVKGYEIEGDDGFVCVCVCVCVVTCCCVRLLREWGKELFRSLSLLLGFSFFPYGCWFVLNF